MRFLIALVFAVMVCLQPVFAVVINEGLIGPTFALEMTGPSPVSCGAKWTCPDGNFTVQTDYTAGLSDGAQGAGSEIKLKNKADATGKLGKVVFATDILSSGKYSVRILPDDNIPVLVLSYYVNDTDVNSSYSVNFSNLVDSKWYEFDVTELVRSSHDLTGLVAIRLWSTDAADKKISEVYLKQPPVPGDFQIIDQGTRIARVDAWVENEWLAISSSDNFHITNATCSIESVIDGATNISLNVSVIPSNTSSSPDKLRVRWYANSSHTVEGRNYEIECAANFDGVIITGLEQYVYVTQEGSAQNVFTKLMQWVKSLFMTLTVQTSVVERPISPGSPQQVLVEVLREKQPYDGAQCNVSVLNGSNLGVVVSNAPMSYYQGGYYNYTFIPLSSELSYVVRSVCVVNNTENFTLYQSSGSLDVAAGATVNVNQIFEGTPSLDLLQGAGYAGSPSQILARLSVGSNSVTNAECNVTAYYPANTTKVINNQQMSYSGDDGIYNYTWTPPTYVTAVYPARVSCKGGSLGTMTVQAATGLRIDDGVYMQSVT